MKEKAVRLFPYSKYFLYEGDPLGGFYGINITIYRLFGVKKFTKLFKTYDNLKNHMEKRGYKIIK